MAREKSLDTELAELGAAVKFAELQRQMDELVRRFPSLQGSRQALKAVRSVRTTVRKRRRRRMSAEKRAAVSARMKKYWAERRKAKGAKA